MTKYLFILFIFFISSCKDLSNSISLLMKKKWSYEVTIKPEIDKPIVYKKINYSIGKTKLKMKYIFHF